MCFIPQQNKNLKAMTNNFKVKQNKTKNPKLLTGNFKVS